MNKKRVVITGMSGITALGNSWNEIQKNMLDKKTATRTMHEWDKIEGLNTRLGAPIEHFEVPSHYTRKQLRAMGRVAKLATVASDVALQQSGLIDETDFLTSGNVGVAYGSCSGSTRSLCDLTTIYTENSMKNVTATTYVKAMSHTCAVNIGLFFGICGRVIPTSSACTSGSQAIGYAYETIKNGYQTAMVAGGAEELCISQVAIFDTLYATSQRNNEPHLTPRPFDRDRDGLVLGEGSCTLILEEYEHAIARGAKIYGEIVGFGTNCDATHITQPTASTMQHALQLALDDAQLPASEIGYIAAHGTATDRGDIAESFATETIYGNNTPISALKSYFGHTLGACGALETWLTLEMMHRQHFIPTINLDNIDPNCASLDYITKTTRQIDCEYAANNNFAFGGINTSLIIKRSS